MTIITDWVSAARRHLANPQLVISDALDQLEATLDGSLDIANPTSPYMHLLETGGVNASALLLEQEAFNRRQYPSLSMTQDDLYLHMSDDDYADRFAQPAKATFVLYLGRDEIYRRAVEYGTAGARKLIIPRHTEILVAGLTFTLQYPIEIRIMPHGGLSVVYDNSQLSPLQELTSNQVVTKNIKFQGESFVRLDIPMYQFAINSQSYTLNRSQLSVKTFTFQDQFHYARVYRADSLGNWIEIKTTHTDQVFDPNVPTAALQVNGQNLTVRIPQVYTTLRMLDTELRVDIYTTRGPLEIVLADYTPSQFTAHWLDHDVKALDVYQSVITKFNTYSLFSDNTISGGRNALSLSELRDRVITNSLGKINVPITNVNIGSRLADMGYDLVLDVDNITNRQFLATRSLPEPIDGSTVSGAGCTMLTLTESMANLAALPTASDNGNRVTLLPSTLYQNVNGVVSIVPQSVVDSLNALPIDVRARRVNENNFLYSPFHYVLDMNDDRFEHRPYYLEAPVVETKSFITENPTSQISVGVKGYQINRVDQGYLLTVTVTSGQAWKDLADNQVFCQASFFPTGERNRAYQNGTQVGLTTSGDRVFTFLIGTEYDLDATDSLLVNTFQMFDDPVHVYPCPLDVDIDIMFLANQIEVEGFTPSTIDEDLGRTLVTADTIGLSQERLTVQLGKALPGLWAASRSVASSQDYQRYLADVPAVYSEIIYQRDPVTGAIEWTVDGDNNIQFVILHQKGDPVLNDQGQPVMTHFAGDIVQDVDGNPVVVSSRQMLRQIDLFLVDGAYAFASDQATVDYKQSIPATITDWLSEDIASVQSTLLEQTVLYFYPKATLGNINVKVLENKTVSINSAQSFAVTYYLSGTQYRDAALRAALTTAAVKVIHDQLQASVVTLSAIISALRDEVMSDSIGISVTGLGGSTPYDTVTLLDDSARLSIRKKAVAKADGTIGVEDDVNVAFLAHTPN